MSWRRSWITTKIAASLGHGRNYKPGALNADGKRSGTEKGFRK
jgi:hypothetical protein